VKGLVNEIATIVGVEALASALTAADGPKDETPIGFEYTTTTIEPQQFSLVPILRSGLGMVEGPYPAALLSIYCHPSIR
jgi:uracil phosphoribosyltransferase